MTLFQPGKARTGGRRRGARDKLSTTFLTELAADFEEHGAEVIKIARVERPVDYLKVVASVLPREFEFTDSTLAELSDDELREFIKFAKSRVISGNAGSGTAAASAREPAAILQALPEAKEIF